MRLISRMKLNLPRPSTAKSTIQKGAHGRSEVNTFPWTHATPLAKMHLILAIMVFGTISESFAAFSDDPQAATATQKATPIAAPEEIRIWPSMPPEPVVPSEPAEKQETGPDGLTRRFHVSVPRLFVHRPSQPPTERSGHVSSAVIVVPGGGFARLADEHEGSDVCRWLSSHGVTAFQLAYRTPTAKHPQPFQGPVQDLQRSIELIRSRAEEFHIDPNAIGVMGFSAGGQTAAIATFGERLVPAQDIPQKAAGDHLPNFLMLVYPYQLLASGSTELRPELQLNSAKIPVWIAQSSDDKASAPEGSIQMYLGLRAQNTPVELHLYELGGHGFGMRPRPNANGSEDWSGRAERWMQMHGWMPASPPSPQKTQSSASGTP